MSNRKLRLVGSDTPTPGPYRQSVEKAKRRSLARSHGPVMDGDETGWKSPFDDIAADWHWMVLDAFGTRSHAVAGVFINSLVDLCRGEWNGEAWIPEPAEMTHILHIIAAHKPKNEAQAALAAQSVALHIVTMKLAGHASRHISDTRSLSALAQLAKASAMQVQAMATLQGKSRTAKQRITVTKEQHVHHHQHIHAETPGGGSGNGGNSHASRAEPSCRCTPLLGSE